MAEIEPQKLNLSLSNAELEDQIDDIKAKIESDAHKVLAIVEAKFGPSLSTKNTDIQYPLVQAHGRCQKLMDELDKSVSQLTIDINELDVEPKKKLENLRLLCQHLNQLVIVEGLYTRILETEKAGDNFETMKVFMEVEPKLTEMYSTEDPCMKSVVRMLKDEIAFKKMAVIKRLKDYLRDYISITSETTPDLVSLTIKKGDVQMVSRIMTTLLFVNEIHGDIEFWASIIMNGFCSRIVESNKPTQLLNMEDNLEDIVLSVSKEDEELFLKEMKEKSKASAGPLEIIQGLSKFFEFLGQAIEGLAVGELYLVSELGLLIGRKLAELVIAKCLIPAVPYEKKDTENFEIVKKAADDFFNLMVKIGFFTNETASFNEYSENFDEIFINRRCAKLCEKARSLALETCSQEIEVGDFNDQPDVLEEFYEDFEKKVGLKFGNLKIDSKNQLPRIWSFQRCRIARNVQDFGNLLIQTFEDIMSSTENPKVAGRLLTTAHNIIRIFLLTSVNAHDEIIKTVPLFGALFFNACHYINHIVLLYSINLRLKLPKELTFSFPFTNLITENRTLAAEALEIHLLHMRRQISSMIGPNDLFSNLKNDAGIVLDCTKTVESCGKLIQQVFEIWKGVFSDAVLVRAIGIIVSHTFAVFVDVILSREDISAAESTILAQELNKLVKKLEKVMNVENQPMIQVLCEREYYRMKEVLYCLNGSIIQIADRWCDGKGTLALWMKSDEVKGLIKALFMNTNQRAQILGQIS